MKNTFIIIVICFASVYTCSAQYHIYSGLHNMINNNGTYKTISILDSVIQILYSTPFDTASNNAIWYCERDSYSIDELIAVNNSYSTRYASIYLRAYYWMCYLSINEFPILSIDLSSDDIAILYDKDGDKILDFFIFQISTQGGDYENNDLFEIDSLTIYNGRERILKEKLILKERLIIPNKMIKKNLLDIKNAYIQWIEVVKKEGLETARRKNISPLPFGYKWIRK